MNKAKIILSTLALFAIIGSALAFKTNRFGSGLYRAITSTTTVIINGVPFTYPLCGGPNYTTTNTGVVSTYYPTIRSFSYVAPGPVTVTISSVCTTSPLLPFTTSLVLAVPA
jgi:hypothetical protein